MTIEKKIRDRIERTFGFEFYKTELSSYYGVSNKKGGWNTIAMITQSGEVCIEGIGRVKTTSDLDRRWTHFSVYRDLYPETKVKVKEFYNWLKELKEGK